jgi:glycosyltransferase involved in cell wall biosynthesis
MKLLHIIHYPIFGGPHNEILRLARPLADRGWDSLVLLPAEPGTAADRLSSAGIEIVKTPLHRVRVGTDPRLHIQLLSNLPTEISHIRRIISERNVKLALIGGLVNPHGAIAARLEGIPVVWQVVDTRAPLIVRRTLMSLVLKLSDVVMFNGRALIKAHIGQSAMDIPYTTYYPPVDTSVFIQAPDRNALVREELGIRPGASVIGTVANLNPMKGLEYFIRAASRIHRARPDTWFLVVGAHHLTHRRYLERLKEELASSGIPSERFIFTGARTDVENLYAAMDVKLVTSVPRSEGTTTTAVEAMACGIPVIATDVGAVREVVEHGVTGFIVRPLDAVALSDRTLQLLNDQALRLKMGRAARTRSVEEFDTSVCVDRYVRAFQTALQRRRLLKAPY